MDNLTAQQEDQMLEAGMEAYYEKKYGCEWQKATKEEMEDCYCDDCEPADIARRINR